MNIKKLKEIADRHELDVIDKDGCLLLNSYKTYDRYKAFYIEENSEKIKFYKEFIDELIKNIRTRDFFKQVLNDTEGYANLFEDLAFLIREYGKSNMGE